MTNIHNALKKFGLVSERSIPAPPLFGATLVGRRNAKLSVPAVPTPWSFVGRILLVHAPNAAIQFYDQFCCWRIKISDVSTDRFLPIELHAVDLFSSQALPQM